MLLIVLLVLLLLLVLFLLILVLVLIFVFILVLLLVLLLLFLLLLLLLLQLLDLLLHHIAIELRVFILRVEGQNAFKTLQRPLIDLHRLLRHLLFPIWIQSVEKYADQRPQTSPSQLSPPDRLTFGQHHPLRASERALSRGCHERWTNRWISGGFDVNESAEPTHEAVF